MQTAEVPIQLNSLVRVHAIQVYPFGSFQAKDGRPAQQRASLPLSLPPSSPFPMSCMQKCKTPHFAGTQFGSAVGILILSWVSQVLNGFN